MLSFVRSKLVVWAPRRAHPRHRSQACPAELSAAFPAAALPRLSDLQMPLPARSLSAPPPPHRPTCSGDPRGSRHCPWAHGGPAVLSLPPSWASPVEPSSRRAEGCFRPHRPSPLHFPGVGPGPAWWLRSSPPRVPLPGSSPAQAVAAEACPVACAPASLIRGWAAERGWHQPPPAYHVSTASRASGAPTLGISVSSGCGWVGTQHKFSISFGQGKALDSGAPLHMSASQGAAGSSWGILSRASVWGTRRHVWLRAWGLLGAASPKPGFQAGRAHHLSLPLGQVQPGWRLAPSSGLAEGSPLEAALTPARAAPLGLREGRGEPSPGKEGCAGLASISRGSSALRGSFGGIDPGEGTRLGPDV